MSNLRVDIAEACRAVATGKPSPQDLLQPWQKLVAGWLALGTNYRPSVLETTIRAGKSSLHCQAIMTRLSDQVIGQPLQGVWTEERTDLGLTFFLNPDIKPGPNADLIREFNDWLYKINSEERLTLLGP